MQDECRKGYDEIIMRQYYTACCVIKVQVSAGLSTLVSALKIVLTVAPRPSSGTDGMRTRLSGSGGGTLRHVAYRKPKTWGCGEA